SSYGAHTETSGKIRVVRCLRIPVKHRDVIVIEDIVDTGTTLDFFLKYLRRRKPASVKVCALLDKVSRRRVPVSVDYRGFVVPDKFVVGYGIDWNERFRSLPGIYALEGVRMT
ncbi:MAG: hypoxanthine phosphoribosyltransferase, partial [Chloroflexi bacterium]|nr:hypoxanthine phosphoribosyltransferase [Chloroflexota bacterium]